MQNSNCRTFARYNKRMARAERDFRQLEAFETEYVERLTAHKKRGKTPYLDLLNAIAQDKADFAGRVTGIDDEDGRLLALRGKIRSLREKLGADVPEGLLDLETPFVSTTKAKVKAKTEKDAPKIHFLADPAPEGYRYPVTFEQIRAVLAELPTEHVKTIHEIRLSNQKRTGSDGDYLDGEIRLHCLIASDDGITGRRVLGRYEDGQDVTRFGGKLKWEGTRLVAIWPLDAYATFVLRRVLVHEVAHGVADLPGFAEKVRSVGSIEKFCEQYAENFYRPAGKSVRLGF